LFLYSIGKATEWSIVIINYFMRFFIIWLIKKLNYKTRSEETRDIYRYIFLMQFLNTGPLLLLVNADLSESGIPILNRVFTEGFHRDFTVYWYKDVGKIIMKAMIY
jgi:hypothetical protein